MSSHSNYSLYAPYVSSKSRVDPPQQTNQQQPRGGAKEAEVDALTHLLLQSMDSAPDADFYGKFYCYFY
jgi:hypothetical protein